MSDTEQTLPAARDALARHAWRDALDLLSAADAQSPLAPEDLERLGEAAWWCGDMERCTGARERAHTGYLDAGSRARAAYIALLLSRDHGEGMSASVAAGWRRRAERLLDSEPDCPEKASLYRARAWAALEAGDPQRAHDLATAILELGNRFENRDLQALGVQTQGHALIAMGRVDEGMACIDEATVAAVSGELSPYTTGVVYCNTIAACAELADYRRASEWTEAAKRWCERQSITGFPGVCRVHRAEILRLRGSWAEAEREARQATEELRRHGLISTAADALNEVGMIRLRMGDVKAAEEAFRQAHEMGAEPHLGLSLLRLAQGRPDAAASLIARGLHETSDRLARARLLHGQADIARATGDASGAREAAEELEAIAGDYGSPALSAAAAGARGIASLLEGNPDDAVDSLRRSWTLWQEVDAPYEAASARGLLGEALTATGDTESGVLELRAACSVYEGLGAALDAGRLAELLDQAGAPRSAASAVRTRRTLMFTDIVGSTSLVEAIGDEAWEDLRRWHDEALRSLFAEHGGEEVDHAGDGFFVAFEDGPTAVGCAVAIQRRLAEHRRTHGFAPQVRIGLHATEATRRGGGYGGRGVHLAARIGALAGGGEILATRETLDGGVFATSEGREVSLKGIAEAVEVVTIEWRQPG